MELGEVKMEGGTRLSMGEKGEKGVNIFHKRNYCVTISLSAHCKTYCYALRKRRFYTVKAALLRCKRAAFGM